jgi:hypothetical protein
MTEFRSAHSSYSATPAGRLGRYGLYALLLLFAAYYLAPLYSLRCRASCSGTPGA